MSGVEYFNIYYVKSSLNAAFNYLNLERKINKLIGNETDLFYSGEDIENAILLVECTRAIVILGAIQVYSNLQYNSDLKKYIEDEVAKVEVYEGAGEAPATDELITQMNKRKGVNARFATGDEEAYLKAVDAEASYMMENGISDMIFRKDVSTRWTAFQEWLHRYLQRKNGGMITPGEDNIIEIFLERHKELFKIGKQ